MSKKINTAIPKSQTSGALTQTDENALKEISVLLRVRTKRDFSQYKPIAIRRLVEWRMDLQQIASVDSYVRFLFENPGEVDALSRDLLIGVTKFFRDPDAFRMLQHKVLPRLVEHCVGGEVLRVWVPACSTGEEACSIAILIQEYLDEVGKNIKVTVFATDIDTASLAVACNGVYPLTIAADVTPERLARYFTLEADGSGYRTKKNIRDMLVFSEHDLVTDPPLSQLDLISCRNLLIYMNSTLQSMLLQMFYRVLNPGAFLFLGTSESIGENSDIYSPIDRKEKIYQRKEDIHPLQCVHRIAESYNARGLMYEKHEGIHRER